MSPHSCSLYTNQVLAIKNAHYISPQIQLPLICSPPFHFEHYNNCHSIRQLPQVLIQLTENTIECLLLKNGSIVFATLQNKSVNYNITNCVNNFNSFFIINVLTQQSQDWLYRQLRNVRENISNYKSQTATLRQEIIIIIIIIIIINFPRLIRVIRTSATISSNLQ